MRLAIILLLVGTLAVSAATSFTEFYVQTTGANTNAGSTTDNTAPYSFVSGNWTNTTAKFFKSTIDLSALTTNMFASVYADGVSVSAFVARIKSIDDANDVIELDPANAAGTNPGDIVGTASISIGGAWSGPSGAVGFPFNFATATLTNFSGNVPRINIKGGTTYAITAGMTHTLAGPLRFQGYTNTVGDFGKATFDCATVGAGVVILTSSGANLDFADMVFSNSGATSGVTDGITSTGHECTFRRLVAHNVRRTGIVCSGNSASVIECEAYLCNANNTASQGGFSMSGLGDACIRCISHDNAGSNSSGFIISGTGCIAVSCIADSNGGRGFLFSNITGGAHYRLRQL